jgi:hypothetical protein
MRDSFSIDGPFVYLLGSPVTMRSYHHLQTVKMGMIPLRDSVSAAGIPS